MNGAILLALVSAFFLAGYFLYAKIIERVLGVTPSHPTPAHTLRDNVDFVPTNPTVLFGHHFATIAGAGPIVGPILAAEFGWAAVTLWIVFGCVFIGAVHDMVAMFLSVRRRGMSMGTVIGTILGKPGRTMFLIFSFSTLVLVVAEFNRQIVGTFIADPAIATASILFIIEAICFGICVNRLKMSITVATLIFVPLMFASVWVGTLFPLDLVSILGLQKETVATIWTVAMLAYCFTASTCPVQYLLQPRDYLNSYLLYVMMILGILGVFVAHPTLNTAAFAGFSVIGRAGTSDLLFPFLFVTVACGACSGFHALAASGTSSKQIDNERNIRPIAYGGMLLEGVLATVAIIGVAGTYLSQADYAAALQTKEPVQIFASTVAGFCGKIGIPQRVAEGFMLLAVSAFLMTTVDSGSRLARFSFQEMMPRKSFAHNKFFGTALICGSSAVLLLGSPNTAKQIWTLFASANQLLAALTLLAATLWFVKKNRPTWITAIPMALMMSVSSTALGMLLWKSFAGDKIDWIKGGTAAFLLILAAALITYAARALIFGKRR